MRESDMEAVMITAGTERQRTVLTAMVKKAQQSDLTTVNKLINEVCGDIQTSFFKCRTVSACVTGFPIFHWRHHRISIYQDN